MMTSLKQKLSKARVCDYVCAKEYAKNTFYPYPVKEKILTSKYYSNTTTFVYINKPGYGGDSTINIRRTNTSQDLLKKINELLDEVHKKNK